MQKGADIQPGQELFQKNFGPRDYLTTYYPHDVDAGQLLATLRVVRKEFDAQGIIDIEKTVKDTGTAPETVENLVIMDFQRTLLRYLAKEFPRGNGAVLEVGGGPTIYQHIALSLAAGHIVHSEFLEGNRNEVHQWLHEGEGAYNWDPYFNLMKMMLAEDPEYQALLVEQSGSEDAQIKTHVDLVKQILTTEDLTLYKERVRRCLKGVTAFGDLFHPNLGWDTPVTREWILDLVVSNFAAESATDDRAKWETGMRNIMSFVRPGGLLSLGAIRNASWYQVGSERMPAVSINEVDMREICAKEGFTILETRVLTGSPKEAVGYDGMVFMLARKGV